MAWKREKSTLVILSRLHSAVVSSSSPGSRDSRTCFLYSFTASSGQFEIFAFFASRSCSFGNETRRETGLKLGSREEDITLRKYSYENSGLTIVKISVSSGSYL